MTPANIAGMAYMNGLQIIALTDHNSVRNCPAFFAEASGYPICPIAGMELTTAEEIHLLCLFPTLEAALSFGSFVDEHRVRYPNRPEIFGRQTVYDENDRICEEVPFLLPPATDLSLDEAVAELRRRGAFVCPAHIDRPANGMIGILGTIPQSYGFSCVEFSIDARAKGSETAIMAEHGLNQKIIYNSDAHFLWDIADGSSKLALPFDHPTAENVIEYLKK